MTGIKLYVAVGADKSARRAGMYEPYAYGAILVNSGKRVFWGYGNYKDSTALFPQAIVSALENYLGVILDAHDKGVPVGIDIDVIVSSPGFWSRLDTHHKRELDGKAEDLDQRDVWKNMTILSALCPRLKPRKPKGRGEEETLLRAKQIQKEWARKALTDIPDDHLGGIYREGSEDEEA